MKQLIYIALSGILLWAGHSCTNRAGKEMQKPTITVTIEPLRYFAEAIAGDNYSVISMVPGGAVPETYDPTPQQLVALGNSEAYLRIGYIGFEQTWMDRLTTNAPDMKVFDTSEGIDLIREEDAHHGDHSHAGGAEPHVWTSPENARIIAGNIYKALCSLDSANSAYYAHRLDSLNAVILNTDKEIKTLLADADRAFMIYHPALSYFARDYGLRQIPIEKGGKEPSPSYLKELMDLCKNEDIHVIFVQPEFDVRNAETIARQTGTKVVPINPLSYEWAKEMSITARALHDSGSMQIER